MITLALGILSAKAQTSTVADFESLTLGTDTFYDAHTSLSWNSSNATFHYFWDATYSLWDAGFAYTNKNNTTNHTYTNLYGAVTGKGYNNSSNYVTASQGYAGQKMNIKLAAPQETVSGFYVTNTTYGYYTMLNGGGPAREFGDTLHTHSGLLPGNFPDWFRLSIYGYKNGVKKADTVAFYLADYRFADNSQDYIVNSWKWVDCTRLGSVDSICMQLYSSDAGQYGINNPTYFCIDNFTTLQPSGVGIAKNSDELAASVYPNPFNASLNIVTAPGIITKISVLDITGKTVHHETLADPKSTVNLENLQAGIYFLEMNSGNQKTTRKIIKH